MNDREVVVRLTVHEARALAFCSNLFGEVFAERVGEHNEPFAAESGAMKLEVALVQAQEAVS